MDTIEVVLLEDDLINASVFAKLCEEISKKLNKTIRLKIAWLQDADDLPTYKNLEIIKIRTIEDLAMAIELKPAVIACDYDGVSMKSKNGQQTDTGPAAIKSALHTLGLANNSYGGIIFAVTSRVVAIPAAESFPETLKEYEAIGVHRTHIYGKPTVTEERERLVIDIEGHIANKLREIEVAA